MKLRYKNIYLIMALPSLEWVFKYFSSPCLLSVHGKGYVCIQSFALVLLVHGLWDIFGSQLVNLFPEQQQLFHHQRVFALTAPGVQQLGKEAFQDCVLLQQLSVLGKLPCKSAGRSLGSPGLDLCSVFLSTDGQLETAASFQ